MSIENPRALTWLPIPSEQVSDGKASSLVRNHIPSYETQHRANVFSSTAMAASTVLIFTRCVYRSVEMSQGWGGPLAHNQETFLVFESIIVWTAGAALLAFHPGFAYVFMRQLELKIGGPGGVLISGVELEEGVASKKDLRSRDS